MVLFLILEQWFIFSWYFQFVMCLMSRSVACFVPIPCLVVWLHKMWNITARTAFFCLDMLRFFSLVPETEFGYAACAFWTCHGSGVLWYYKVSPLFLYYLLVLALLFISHNYFYCRCIIYLLFLGFLLLSLSNYHMWLASCIRTSASSLPGFGWWGYGNCLSVLKKRNIFSKSCSFWKAGTLLRIHCKGWQGIRSPLAVVSY